MSSVVESYPPIYEKDIIIQNTIEDLKLYNFLIKLYIPFLGENTINQSELDRRKSFSYMFTIYDPMLKYPIGFISITNPEDKNDPFLSSNYTIMFIPSYVRSGIGSKSIQTIKKHNNIFNINYLNHHVNVQNYPSIKLVYNNGGFIDIYSESLYDTSFGPKTYAGVIPFKTSVKKVIKEFYPYMKYDKGKLDEIKIRLLKRSKILYSKWLKNEYNKRTNLIKKIATHLNKYEQDKIKYHNF
jgi:hypothetical protein